MNDDQVRIENTVRTALRDAADHVTLVSPSIVTDTHARGARRPARRRARLAAAVAVAVVVASVVGVIAVTRHDHDAVRVGASGDEVREVPVAAIPRDAADLEVYMTVKATGDETAGVHTQLEASPLVARYAFVDRDATYQEFADIFACNPDLVRSIRPEDLPESFRVITTPGQADAPSQLVDQLRALPGVESVEMPNTTSQQSCEDTLSTIPNDG